METAMAEDKKEKSMKKVSFITEVDIQSSDDKLFCLFEFLNFPNHKIE